MSAPHPGREKDDFYRTPEAVTRALLVKETFGKNIWEPACGDGAISRVLEQAGMSVQSTDLVFRGYGYGSFDFLEEFRGTEADIITNPPFKLAERFVLHAIELGAPKVAMLLRLSWLEGERRRAAVFDRHPPSRVWVLSRRPTLWHGTDPNARSTGGAISYAWFVWDRGATGAPQLGWIGANDVRDAEAREFAEMLE